MYYPGGSQPLFNFPWNSPTFTLSPFGPHSFVVDGGADRLYVADTTYGLQSFDQFDQGGTQLGIWSQAPLTGTISLTSTGLLLVPSSNGTLLTFTTGDPSFSNGPLSTVPWQNGSSLAFVAASGDVLGDCASGVQSSRGLVYTRAQHGVSGSFIVWVATQ
jgi:hypothetical protein